MTLPALSLTGPCMRTLTGPFKRTFPRLLRSLPAALMLASVWALPAAHAQGEFPQKPIRIVVTFPPGGSADAVVRLIAPRLADKLGQQVVVDNRPGAGGNIGMTAVAKSPADGYTLGVGAAGALAANSSLYPQMPFDVQKDFKPVGLLAAIPFVIVANPSSVPARTLRELIAQAKAQPARLSLAHGGNGTAMHLSAELFNQMADVKISGIPYKGSGPAALDVVSGQVQLGVVDLPAALQLIRAGRLTALAVTSPQRLPQLPDVPTVAESGLAGYDATGWFGVVAPAGTPVAIVNRLSAEVSAALKDEGIRSALRAQGVEPAPSTPEAFEAYIRSETLKWSQVIRSANIKLD